MKNDKQDFVADLNRVMGKFIHRGRSIEKTSNGYIMSGIKFNNMDEVNKAIDVICKALNKSIR